MTEATTEATTDVISGWFAGRLPADLFEALVEVVVDREEITVIGRIPEPALPDDATDAARAGAVEGKVGEFRERTREARMAVAEEAQHRFERRVSWGVECGGARALFTSVSAPVMTRLRQPERQVLDLLVEAGVARSRSDALGWCVRLVRRHADEWLEELRQSLTQVQEVRARAPEV